MPMNLQGVLYLHCQKCLDDVAGSALSPADYMRLEVAISEEGDLIVNCRRHHEEVAFFENESIAEALRAIPFEACDSCGESCAGSPKGH